MMDKRAIHDDGLEDLAQTLAEMWGVSTTEALRLAPQNEIERQRSKPTLDEQIAALDPRQRHRDALLADEERLCWQLVQDLLEVRFGFDRNNSVCGRAAQRE